MNFLETIRTMDRRLRVMLIASALLIIPLIGQFVAAADIKRTGHEGDLALFFMFAAIFIVPTSLILTAAIFAGIRHQLRQHRALVVIGAINLLISLDLIWFFVRA